MLERFAPYARYVAIAGLVALVLSLAGLLVVGQPNTWIEVTGSVGLVLLAASVLLRPAEIKAALTGRRARYGGNAVLMSVAFFAIVGLLNYLGARHHGRWDVTEEKQFSLSEQSIRLLQSLTEPVQVKLFFTPDHYNRFEAEDLIKEYAVRSSKLSYEFIDMDVQRRLALEYQVSRDGTIIFERGDRREVTFGVGEQDLTSALLKVTRDEVKGVYFLTGHQERDPESFEEEGYSTLKQVLLSENYAVDRFNYAVTDTVPSEVAVLVVAGPTKPLSAEETRRL
ncbi:MAG TPA: GldG family protein, partial [Anaerolineae bacterium]|nr:GldG family protein [Anaerolineae bacterium]